MFKHKKLFIVFLTFLMLFYFCTSCFAGSSDFYNTLPTTELSEKILDSAIMPELTDLNYYCFIWYHSSIGYMAWFFDKNTISDDFNISLDCYGSSTGKWYLTGSAVAKQYVFDGSGNLQSSGERTFTNGSWDEFHNYCFYIQNMTVYTVSGDVFFQGPPSLMRIAEGAGMEQTIKQIVLILPLILVVVVSFLGLRKALALLLSLLRRCLML